MEIQRILLATDAWHPQVNGVVRTLDATIRELRRLGKVVRVIEPGLFRSCPLPFYPEIWLAWPTSRRIQQTLAEFQPDAVHICTEGPVGFAVRRQCLARGWRFTTAYHTKFADYAWKLACIPTALAWRYLRWFHRPSAAVQVATASMERELGEHGFRCPIRHWSRGVDLKLFHPRPAKSPQNRPVHLYVGRVSREKGLESFLTLRTEGVKWVVGDGPARRKLQARYRDTVFLGALHGSALADVYADADVFVFPSRTDTFGLVILEALASGVPVAAFPVAGPRDILIDDAVGGLDNDLGRAVQLALRRGNAEACVRLARQYTWTASTLQFLGNLTPVHEPRSSSALQRAAG